MRAAGVAIDNDLYIHPTDVVARKIRWHKAGLEAENVILLYIQMKRKYALPIAV